MKLALIKTTSMGDVIHALPVVTDILLARPGATIDWVVEESFAELPPLHPGVASVIPVAVRRWRRTPFGDTTRWEIWRVKDRLRSAGYDLVLDLQGLLKSAWLARMARAPVAGFSRRCAREPLASLLYRQRYDVDMRSHAIERLRSLAAQALGYEVRGLPQFGLRAPAAAVEGLPASPYWLLLHATSRAEKQWPEERWRELIARAASRGVSVALPWGSDAERERAQRLAEGAPHAAVLPRLTLTECAATIARAQAVVGVDTGLTHLSSALDAPTVALFAATPAWRFGPYWTPRATSLGADGAWPSAAEVERAIDAVRGAGA